MQVVPPLPSPASTPAFRNFWFVSTTGDFLVNPGDPLLLNQDSIAAAGGITRAGNIITIPLAGNYFISYVVTVAFHSNNFSVPTAKSI